MSWGYRLRIPEGARANGIDKVLPYEKRVVTAGKLIPFLERVKGRPSWGAARYGLNLYSGHSGKLFWNAKRNPCGQTRHGPVLCACVSPFLSTLMSRVPRRGAG